MLAVALTLSGCGIFGGSDSTDVTVAEDIEAQPTVNNVQSVPSETSEGSTTDAPAAQGDSADDADSGSADESGTAALPTAVTLPTAAPTPEPTVDRSQQGIDVGVMGRTRVDDCHRLVTHDVGAGALEREAARILTGDPLHQR